MEIISFSRTKGQVSSDLTQSCNNSQLKGKWEKMRRASFIYSECCSQRWRTQSNIRKKKYLCSQTHTWQCLHEYWCGWPVRKSEGSDKLLLAICYLLKYHSLHYRLKYYAQYILYIMFFEKTRTMSLEYLKTTYTPELGFKKGSKLTPSHITSNSVFKVKMM